MKINELDEQINLDILNFLKKDKKKNPFKGIGFVYKTSKVVKGKEYTYWVAKFKTPKMKKIQYKYFEDESKATDFLNKMKEELDKGGSSYIDSQMTVKEYMDNWLNTTMRNKLKKQKSFDCKENTLKNYVYPYIGDLIISQVTFDDIQNDLINKLDKTKSSRPPHNTLSHSTIKKAYEAVNACLKLAVIKDVLSKNPCEGVVLPASKEKEISDIRYFNDDEIERISKTCLLKYNNGDYIYRLGWAVIFLMYTGLRIGEFLSLKFSDIDYINKNINIDKTISRVINRDYNEDDENSKKTILLTQIPKSTSSKRVVPLSEKAFEAAEELKKINGQFVNVACTSKGKIIHERAFDRMLRAICKRSGIDECGAHVLRHTFASLLFRRGVEVKTVSDLLGHKSVTVAYNIYIHLIEDQKKQAINLLDYDL